MATGDILSVTVRADGWSADLVVEGFTTGATYAFGLGTNNANIGAAKMVFTVVSEGYNSSGVLGTITRTVYGVSTVRKAYPDELSGSTGAGLTKDETGGGNLTVRIALSEPIYNDDNTGAGKSGTAPTVTIAAGLVTNTGGSSQTSAATTALTVTNNSTLDYPQVIGQWDHIAGVCTADRVQSNFTLAANTRHKFGIAAVKFIATGATSGASVNSTVTTETATIRSATSLYQFAHQVTLAITGFTQGELINADFIAYPLVGDADSILDTSGRTTTTNEPLGFNRAVLLCDKTASLDDIVYVATTGNDTTGDGSNGNPYATIAKGMKEGNIVYLKAGTHAAVGSTQTRKTTSEWVIVRPAPGESSSTVTVQLTTLRTYRCERLRYHDVKITMADATSYWDGEHVGNFLRVTNCVFDGSGVASPSPSFGYRSHCTYIENCTGDLSRTEWTLVSFSTNRTAYQFDGCIFAESSSVAGAIDAWFRVVACSGTGAVAFGEKAASNTAPAQDNLFFENNRILNYNSSGANVLKMGGTVAGIARGMSAAGNVIEKTAGTSAAVFVGADGSTVNMEHILLWHNTVAGERCNLGYNDTGSSAPTRTNWSMRFNAYRDFNVKDDTFGTPNAARVNGWSVGYAVGFWGNRYEVSNFPGEFGGVDFVLTGDDGIAYADNASFTGDNTGSGDYTPASGSVLSNRIPSGYAVRAFDLYGNTFDNTGYGSAGAIQLMSDIPAASASAMGGNSGLSALSGLSGF